MIFSKISENKYFPTVALSIIIATVGILLWSAQGYFSPVTDELANIPGGLNYLQTGRYTDATQPPLLRYLFAIPQWLMGLDVFAKDESGEYFWVEYAHKFMFANKVNWQTIVSSARAIVIALTLAQIILVYFFSKKIWGNYAALAAAIFIAFEPNTIAHGELATLDLAFSLTFLWVIYALYQYTQIPDWKRFILLNLAVGVSFLTKFSALTLFVSIPVTLFLLRKKRDLHLGRFGWSPLILLFIVAASYLFQVKSAGQDYQISRPRLDIPIKDKIHEQAQKYGLTGDQVLSAEIPLYDFWKGFGMQIFHAMFQDKWRKNDTYQYLLGDYADRGWRTYFTWTFLLKSTIPSIIFTFLFLFLLGKKVIKKTFETNALLLCLLLSPVLYFIVCSMGTINIGHRYLLPVYPFLAMGVGYIFAKSNQKMKYFVSFLLLFHVGSSLSVYPHHLSYFNEFSRGEHYLSDSNIDWGQDMLFLQQDLATVDSQNTQTWGELSGIVKPEHLGFTLAKIPPLDSLRAGKHRIYYSINRYLNRSQVYPNGIHPWLNQYEPVGKIGSSILVYEVKAPPRPSPTLPKKGGSN